MNENNKTTLTEEQLEHAAGGGLTDQVGCHFVHKTGKIRKRPEQGYDPVYEAECGGICHGFGNGGNRCQCHDNADICVNRWHAVTENGSPLPREDRHKHWYA